MHSCLCRAAVIRGQDNQTLVFEDVFTDMGHHRSDGSSGSGFSPAWRESEDIVSRIETSLWMLWKRWSSTIQQRSDERKGPFKTELPSACSFYLVTGTISQCLRTFLVSECASLTAGVPPTFISPPPVVWLCSFCMLERAETQVAHTSAQVTRSWKKKKKPLKFKVKHLQNVQQPSVQHSFRQRADNPLGSSVRQICKRILGYDTVTKSTSCIYDFIHPAQPVVRPK